MFPLFQFSSTLEKYKYRKLTIQVFDFQYTIPIFIQL